MNITIMDPHLSAWSCIWEYHTDSLYPACRWCPASLPDHEKDIFPSYFAVLRLNKLAKGRKFSMWMTMMIEGSHSELDSPYIWGSLNIQCVIYDTESQKNPTWQSAKELLQNEEETYLDIHDWHHWVQLLQLWLGNRSSVQIPSCTLASQGQSSMILY